MIDIKTVLLTGISGFIAKQIALDLLRSGYFFLMVVITTAKADHYYLKSS